eukprot:6212783-Pleurochrysis_carterae.AAC.4
MGTCGLLRTCGPCGPADLCGPADPCGLAGCVVSLQTHADSLAYGPLRTRGLLRTCGPLLTRGLR